MTPESDDFDKLLQALRLKRYEKPHPRYFSDFSSQVISRLAKEDRKRENTLMSLLGRWLMSKPVAAGAGATLVAALAITAWVLPQKSVEILSPKPIVQEQKNQFESDSAPKAFVNFERSSTNPYAPPAGSLFDRWNQQNTLNVLGRPHPSLMTPSSSRTN